jgi:hypothetical protein
MAGRFRKLKCNVSTNVLHSLLSRWLLCKIIILMYVYFSSRRWVDNIKMDLRETGWDGVNWVDVGQDRDQWRALVSTVLNLRVP